VYISKLALQPDGKVLAGGNFPNYQPNGSTGTPLVRLTSAGALDPTFTAAPTATAGRLVSVSALLLQPDGRVVAAGIHVDFTGSGATNYYVARYESTGAQDASFTPQAATGGVSYYSSIFALDRQADGKLLVGGDFTQLGGITRPGFARLTTTGGLDATFVPSPQFSGIVDALVVQPNGRVLLGGHFTPAGSSAGANLTRVLANGQPDASFASTATPNNSVYALLVQPDGAIVLAGDLTLLNNQPKLAIARITAPNVLAVAAPAATAARTSAWPVPAREVLHVAPDPGAQPQLAELLDALGRPVLRQVLTGGAEFTLPTAGLPAGLYLLRVTYAAGAVTRQVVVE
ncbi:MAG: T9SS type A sorting domain-containing protein, partial [Hymenobacter sp.]